jgi:phosphoribosylformylglycinamidine synthase PurS subunit
MIYQAQITIMPLKELLDPQGKAVQESLPSLGIQAIQDVRIGKHIVLQIEAGDAQEAETIAVNACKKILYNPVMEQFHVSISSE